MRLALLIVLALASPARAQQSKMMERALKLYGAQMFYEASIEFHKVLDGMAGDNDETRQRAEFAIAKTFHDLKFHAVAASKLAAISERGAAHAYFVASVQLLLSVLRAAPGPTPRAALFPYVGTSALDDAMNASVRDEFALQLGREIAARQRPNGEALDMLAKSRDPRAELELARVYLRAKAFDRGIAHAKVAARTPALAVEAARLVASWSHLHGHDASAALAELADTSAYARYQASRAKLDHARAALAGVPIEAFDAVLIPSACHGKFPDDVRPIVRRVIDEAKPVIETLIEMTDNNEREEYLRKLRAQQLPGSDAVLAALDDPAFREQTDWLREIEAELALYERSPKGWQATAVAAYVLQELTVLQSIEAANLGAMARTRLQLLKDGLVTLESALAAAPAIAASPDGTLVVTGELCHRGGTAPTLSAKPTSGCAGCATGGRSGWLAALALVMLVRRARRHRQGDARARRG